MLPEMTLIATSASGSQDYQVEESGSGTGDTREVQASNNSLTEGILLGRKEREMLQTRFESIVARLEEYEERYDLESAEFNNAFERRELPETEDYLRWRSVYYAYLRINERYGLSK